MTASRYVNSPKTYNPDADELYDESLRTELPMAEKWKARAREIIRKIPGAINNCDCDGCLELTEDIAAALAEACAEGERGERVRHARARREHD